jgi:hypothetical protein
VALFSALSKQGVNDAALALRAWAKPAAAVAEVAAVAAAGAPAPPSP